MGNGEAATPSKAEKASASVPEQSSVHPYPDWVAMQAYYGSGMAMPPQYFGTNVAQAHPYMWAPPLLMPPFGAPYSAIYPHGVYSQPTDTLEGNGAVISSTGTKAETAATQETPIKSPNNKVMKGSDGLAVSACNGSDENESGSVADVLSQSESEGKDSSDGSNKNNVRRPYHTLGNRASQDIAIGKPAPSDSTTETGGVRLSAPANPKLPVQVRLDDRELKRQKRKQSNRESARRSRLRKQAETEELAQKVESLVAENLALRSEVSQLSKDSARLRVENSALEDKLKEAQSVSTSTKVESGKPASAVTENFLSRISSSTSSTRSEPPPPESPAKLRQLLESSSRAGAAVLG